MRTRKHKPHIALILTVGLAWLILSANAAASDWFVRPAGGNYGSEDGSSYQDAWDGLSNVVWGVGGVEPGDNLYICGLHLRTRTSGSAWEIITPGANGVSENARITIRGDYPGDKGVVWGAGIMAHEPWVDEGSNVWSITEISTPNSMWYFEDITVDSWTVLDKASSLAELQATPGSYYSDSGFAGGGKLYVHASDNGNPTGRIAANRLGYNVHVHNKHYITWKNLEFYCIYRWLEYNTNQYVTYIRWENTTMWYGDTLLIAFRTRSHDVEFINCDIAWAKNGIGLDTRPYTSPDQPYNFTIRGCKIHDIGVRAGDLDAHGISIQGSHDVLIENNEIYNVGSGITAYVAGGQSISNYTIRWNWIHDTHTNGGANSRGIEFNAGGNGEDDTSGNKIYGNIVGPGISCVAGSDWTNGVGYRWNLEDGGEFYNNIAYDCDTSFALFHPSQIIQVELKNLISLNPTSEHIRFASNGNEGEYVIDSDYNLFWPISGKQFFFWEYATASGGAKTFAEWQALFKTGSTFDPNSIAADPLFVDPDNGNFNLIPGSLAIDAGIDIGLTQDFGGNPIPLGSAPDIGAYESVLDPNNQAPIANAGSDQTTTDSDGNGSEQITLDGSDSTDSDGTIQSYVWTEGGTQIATSVSQNVTLSTGQHTITLTVTDDDGATDTDTVTVTINPTNQAPTASAGSDQTITDSDGDGSEQVTLDGSGSTDSDGTIESYVWTESGTQIAMSDSPNVTLSTGQHTITLRVTDDDGASDTDTVTVTINPTNQAPTASAGSDQTITDSDGNGSEQVTLDGSGSTDSDGTIQSYVWSENGTQIATSMSQNVTLSTGQHTITLIVTDDDGATDTDTVTVTINEPANQAPTANAGSDVTTTDSDGNGSEQVTLDGSGSTDPDGTIQSYRWAEGGTQIATSVSPNVTLSTGQHMITLIVGDDDGATDTDTVAVTIYALDNTAPSVTNCSPTDESMQAPLNTMITLQITDAGRGIDATTVTIDVNGNRIYEGDVDHYNSSYGDCRRTGTRTAYSFFYQSNEMFYYDQTVTITVNATDLAGNVMDEYSYSFATEMHSFGQNKQVNSGLDNNDKPVTVCDSSGNIWAAWHAGSVGNRDIYISKLAAGADNFGGTVQLTDNITDQCNPAVALDSLDSNDKLYVVWQDNREGDWDIYVSTSVDGVNWSTEIRVNDPNEGNQVNPAIVIDSQNYAHVVWQDDRAGNQDIYVATSSDGFATKTVSQITSDTFDQIEPAVAADSDNTIYVVWTDGRNGSNDIYGAASNNPWTNVAIVSNANNQSSPAIAAESTGSILHLLWVDDTSGDNDIYYASSDGLPGSPLTGSSIIDDSSGADQLDPTIAVTGSTDNNLKVFACWQDWRNTDTDLYFAELSAGSGTNVFVGDGGSNADQGKPVIGIDEYSHPYLIWADNRSTDTDIYYTGSTFIEPVALASELVTASASVSTTVGTDPQAITTVDDVSIVVPAGACSYDVTITLTKIANLPAFAAPCLGGYDFGPSGIQFSQPVTITIPYVFSGSDGSAKPYWFNSLTGALSQQGITDIQDITISSSLHALSFKTTHFTAFYLLVGGGTAAAIVGGGGGGGGGCSVSATGEGNIAEYILPYIGLAVVMAILKMRDARDRKARNTTAGKY